MADLESILMKFNGKKFNVFKNDGKFTKKGYKVYCDFCGLLYDLESIMPSNTINAECIENEMDSVVAFEH